ncbi:MAG TPA: methyl-accepting chemotaxis protein, partial [Atribacteraceae bacterium]|nr:methyl-accepting chemotaxis protein [Atribacteraceae bacterium]
DMEFFIEARQGNTVITDPIISTVDNNLLIVYATPIRSEGEIVGVLAGVRGGDDLIRVTDGLRFGTRGSYIINQEGALIAHEDRELVMNQVNYIEEAKTKPEFESVAQLMTRMTAGERGIGTYVFQDAEHIVSFAPIGVNGWSIAVGAMEKEVLAGVNTLRNTILTLVAVVLAIGILIAYFVGISLSRPIRSATEKAVLLGEGDLTIEVPATLLKRNDELGSLGHALKKMAAKWLEVIQNTINTSSTLAASSQELASSVEEVSKATQEVAQTISQIAEGSTQQSQELDQVNRQAEEIAAKAATVNQTTARNLTLLKEMRAGLGEGSRSLGEIEAAMQATMTEGEHSRKEAHKGQEVLFTLTGNIHSIAEVAGEVSRAVETLDTRSQEIGKIVEMITGIAEQTNLLALNAAIEAARAGEAGRGFAVVAEEVRKLAEESAQAAQQIARLIAQIREDTQQAVASMDKAAKKVESGVTQSDEVTRSFQTILTAVESSIQSLRSLAGTFEKTRKNQARSLNQAEEVGTLSEDNAGLVKDMTERIQAITASLGSITSVSEENAAGSEEVSASTEEQSASLEEITSASESLAKLAQELQGMVGHFKV